MVQTMMRCFVLVLVIFATTVPLLVWGVTQDEPPAISELIAELERNERADHGLSYDWFLENPRLPPGRQQWHKVFVSRNGRITAREFRVRQVTRSDGAEPKEYLIGWKRNVDEGWFFTISRMIEPGGGLGEAMMTVEFFATGTASEGGGDLDLSIAEYVRQSDVKLQSRMVFDRDVWEMACDHPKLSSKTFYFEKNGLRFLGSYTRVTDTDVEGGNSLHVPPTVMPPGSWKESLIGPIQYETFEGRQLPVSIPFMNNSSEPNSKNSGVWHYKTYRLLENDLSPKIEFETIPLPDDGEPVTSQGEEGIRYELRGGKVVKVIDAPARRSAAWARYYRSGTLYTVWYIVGGALAVSIIWFLARRWSQRQ